MYRAVNLRESYRYDQSLKGQDSGGYSGKISEKNAEYLYLITI
jgi:hypothetical protein